MEKKQVDKQVRDKIRYYMWGQVEWLVLTQIEGQVGVQVWNRVGYQAWFDVMEYFNVKE